MVLMISQAIDTAILSQLLKQENDALILSSVSWSMTEDLFLNGGKSVEGMYMIGLNKAQYPSEAYTSFKNDFQKHYQYEPTFISGLAYDAFHVLRDALKQTESDDPIEIKKAILQAGKIEGLEESFEIDENGDCNRKYLIYQVMDDAFIPWFD
jgi:ABC-type branched-subunit amino acid transport system substrate-binding protein